MRTSDLYNLPTLVKQRMGWLRYQWRSKEYIYQFKARFSNVSGVLENRRETPLIVSLTSIPERLHKVHLCIETLLSQSLKPDNIILWLSDTIHGDDIPENLKRLEKRGLQIRGCRDIGPYTKLIYTLRENPQSIIVTADDDVFYPAYWLKKLYLAYQAEPQYIYCYRAHLMKCNSKGIPESYHHWDYFAPGMLGPSHFLLPTGHCGVLYPAGSLHHEVFNEELFSSICPTGDDIWFKAMSLLNGVACKKVEPFFRKFKGISGTQAKALHKLNVTQNRNDVQIRAVFEHYDLYRLFSSSNANDYERFEAEFG